MLIDTYTFRLTTIPPAAQTTKATLSSVQLVHDAAFVGGKYIKNEQIFYTILLDENDELFTNKKKHCISKQGDI